MKELIFNFLMAFVLFVIGVITRYLVPWIKEKIQGTKLEQVMVWAYKLVQAAEQTITGGEDKKCFVTKKLKEILTAKNLALSDTQIDALIEGIVNELYPKEGVTRNERI